jgi:hypothetical protein
MYPTMRGGNRTPGIIIWRTLAGIFSSIVPHLSIYTRERYIYEVKVTMTEPTPPLSEPYHKALAAIDAAHAQDPKTVDIDGTPTPYELHYAQKCAHYLLKHTSAPSEHLRLAVRAQHFRRWEVPRNTYPMTRIGYHSWRTALKKRQAEQVRDICLESGYEQADAERVASLVNKEGLKTDGETQVLEDVACLVFLDDQFEEFEKGLGDEEKILGILRKTWAKMGERGRELAMQMKLEGRPKELVEKALAG